jgi:hypothetical protein
MHNLWSLQKYRSEHRQNMPGTQLENKSNIQHKHPVAAEKNTGLLTIAKSNHTESRLTIGYTKN